MILHTMIIAQSALVHAFVCVHMQVTEEIRTDPAPAAAVFVPQTPGCYDSSSSGLHISSRSLDGADDNGASTTAVNGAIGDDGSHGAALVPVIGLQREISASSGGGGQFNLQFCWTSGTYIDPLQVRSDLLKIWTLFWTLSCRSAQPALSRIPVRSQKFTLKLIKACQPGPRLRVWH